MADTQPKVISSEEWHFKILQNAHQWLIDNPHARRSVEVDGNCYIAGEEGDLGNHYFEIPEQNGAHQLWPIAWGGGQFLVPFTHTTQDYHSSDGIKELIPYVKAWTKDSRAQTVTLHWKDVWVPYERVDKFRPGDEYPIHHGLTTDSDTFLETPDDAVISPH